MYEYKAVIYREDSLASIILGTANISPENFSFFLNQNASEGWRVKTMERDIQRIFLFFKREAYVVLMEREVK